MPILDNKPPQVRFGLALKLFLLVLFSFGLLMGGILTWIGKISANQAEETISKSLAQSKVILNTALSTRYKSIGETASNLAHDGTIFPVVYAKESANLQDRAEVLQKSLGFDVLIFTDDAGVILARSDNREEMGKVVKGRSALFDEALAGQMAQGIMRSKSELLQVVALPITDNAAKDIVRGTLALAYRLSPDMAREIWELTQSHIGFFTFPGKKEMETAKAPVCQFFTRPDLLPLLLKDFEEDPTPWKKVYEKQDPGMAILTLGNEIYHAVFYSLNRSDGNPEGFVVALRSRTELLRPFEAIKRGVIAVGLVCLAAACLFSGLIARRMARPIVALVDVTRQIQEGAYPEMKSSSRSDEVGILENAVYHMGRELKEKAELEGYLAQVSESMEDTDSIKSLVGDDESPNQAGVDFEKTIDTQNALAQGKTELLQMHPGTQFAGRYNILRLLGSGGMGVVYLAKDLKLEESIALKVILDRDMKGEALEQFKQEIKLARRITHRNVLRTFDLGTDGDLNFISMEYVHGYDLNQLIKKRGALSLKMGLLLAKQMCGAIAAAHSEGIIHRDLKPQNMMINRQGILKIMDFGLALKVSGPIFKEDGTKNEARKEHGIAGTPYYMAPEQFLGQPLDARTDIYALGIILFQMFTAKLPFTGESVFDLAHKHVKQTPPKLSQMISSLPPSLEALISKAISKKSSDRWQSVNELMAALNAIGT